ncbi:MAG: sulfotransferase [Acidimicrobiales bacterium]|nr:sulfotransferase [Acidimicrobiales bacterium]
MPIRSHLQRLGRRLTAPQRPLPSFVVIGAMRSGTTSLFDYLSQHPHVDPPTRKEIHYFDLHYERGLNWYRAFFPWGRPGVISGEASPSYLTVPSVPERLAATLPDAKLIVSLRDPAQRAVSHHSLRTKLGYEHRSLDEALADELSRIDREGQSLPDIVTRVTDIDYLVAGHYAEQLEAWFAHFRRSQFLIVDAHDLFADAGRVYERALRFLGLDAHEPPSFDQLNTGGDRSFGPDTERMLAEYYADHNRALVALLGQPMSWTGGS